MLHLTLRHVDGRRIQYVAPVEWLSVAEGISARFREPPPCHRVFNICDPHLWTTTVSVTFDEYSVILVKDAVADEEGDEFYGKWTRDVPGGRQILSTPSPDWDWELHVFLCDDGETLVCGCHLMWYLDMDTVDATYHGSTVEICRGDEVFHILRRIAVARTGWKKVRRALTVRSIVLFWNEMTAYQMEVGGTAYLRDMAIFHGMLRH